jgi:hypothetical protein
MTGSCQPKLRTHAVSWCLSVTAAVTAAAAVAPAGLHPDHPQAPDDCEAAQGGCAGSSGSGACVPLPAVADTDPSPR